MKYYKDIYNQVYAYDNYVPEFGSYTKQEIINEDGVVTVEKIYSQFTVKEGLIAITKKEAEELAQPKLTQEQITNNNQSIQSCLLNEANDRIAILQDIVDLDMREINEDEQLKAWKKYRILLTRIDVNNLEIVWPTKPQ